MREKQGAWIIGKNRLFDFCLIIGTLQYFFFTATKVIMFKQNFSFYFKHYFLCNSLRNQYCCSMAYKHSNLKYTVEIFHNYA